MKVLFIGCVESSYILLEKLINAKAEIVGVITKEKSKYNADFMDLTPLCIENNIKKIYVDNINEEKSMNFVKETKPDIAFCFGWSQLIKEEFINLIPHGIVGFHPAELPNNRGRHPIIWALVLGLEQTASSFFMIDKNADTGDIISQKKVTIQYEDDAASLYSKIMSVAEEQVVEILKQFENCSVCRVRQYPKEGNSWRKRTIRDGQIDFRMSNKSIYNLVRGLTHPYVGAHFMYGEDYVKVWKVVEVFQEGYENIEPGKILRVNEDGSFEVKSGDAIIKIVDYENFDPIVGEYL